MAILLVLLVVCAIVLAQSSGVNSPIPHWLPPICTVGLTLDGVALGLVLAPTPKPADYTDIAAIAVDEISEMNRSTNALIDRLNTVIASDELSGAKEAKIHLLLVQDELLRQVRTQMREVGRWGRVAPGSEDEIVKGKQTNAATLKKLEMEMDNGLGQG